jgi:hypothetical protein
MAKKAGRRPRRMQIDMDIQLPFHTSGKGTAEDAFKRELEFCREKFEAGDCFFLLSGVDLSVRSGRPVPEPFATEFCNRFVRFATYQAQTLDQAFSLRRRKSKSAQKRHRLMAPIVKRAAELYKTGMPLDDALFAVVGRELKISKSTANKYFYDPAIKVLRLILGLPLQDAKGVRSRTATKSRQFRTSKK